MVPSGPRGKRAFSTGVTGSSASATGATTKRSEARRAVRADGRRQPEQETLRDGRDRTESRSRSGRPPAAFSADRDSDERLTESGAVKLLADGVVGHEPEDRQEMVEGARLPEPGSGGL